MKTCGVSEKVDENRKSLSKEFISMMFNPSNAASSRNVRIGGTLQSGKAGGVVLLPLPLEAGNMGT